MQKVNLTPSQGRGLRKLKKRVKEGELLICETDKSGRFAVVRMETYIAAGRVHTNKDKRVDLEFVKKNQRILNGHTSSFLKIFKVGEDWQHERRHRETKLNQSLGVAPLYLLFKDHKVWDRTSGPPPTRPVGSATSGMNMHFSELVSHILEPV